MSILRVSASPREPFPAFDRPLSAETPACQPDPPSRSGAEHRQTIAHGVSPEPYTHRHLDTARAEWSASVSSVGICLSKFVRVDLGREASSKADSGPEQQGVRPSISVKLRSRLGCGRGITQLGRSSIRILRALHPSRPGRCQLSRRLQELFCPKDRQANAKHRRHCIPRHITSGPGGPSLRRPM